MTIRKRRSIQAALGVFCLGLLVTASALVAQRDSHWAALDIDPEWTNFRSFVTPVNLGVDNEAWTAFENQYGNDFVSQWDFRSGVPHLIYGPGIDTGLTNPDEAQATAVAYDIMTEHNELFRLRDFDMDPYVSHVGNTWYVDMYFYHETIPFDEHSRFAIRLKDNGVIAAIKTYDIPDKIEPSQPTTDLPQTIPVPPSGHLAGLWARTDGVGVWKAPANEVLRGALDLEYQMTTGEQEILNPVAVTIFGGLVSATLLDAFLTPVLFLLFGRKPLERLAQVHGRAAHAEAF